MKAEEQRKEKGQLHTAETRKHTMPDGSKAGPATEEHDLCHQEFVK